MGTYLNPGNSGFQRIRQGDYIDKTGMIALLNDRIDGPENLVCISRPRRFGKSYAAQMLCAYYDKTCQSQGLFEDLAIAGDASYRQYLNRYDVIYVDMTGVLGETPAEDLIPFLKRNILAEIKHTYPDVLLSEGFAASLRNAVDVAGNRFIVIIDEWDAPIRETSSKVQKEYLDFLRSLFKNSSVTSQVFAAVYMTGILPIKMAGSESALSEFGEYTILYPEPFTPYTGFTEAEVRKLCREKDMDFHQAKAWYDGYHFPDVGEIYNPYSLMCAVNKRSFRSFWRKTSAAESLVTYINMDFDGLQELVLRLISGERIEINVDTFNNDLQTFSNRDDVLTLLIHLGYLTYDREEHTVRIPNEEIRREFDDILRSNKLETPFVELLQQSRHLLKDTIAGEEEAVAKAIQKIHESQYAPTFYNNEQALRYVVKYAYIACVGEYMKIEEMPSGHGIADVVFIPKRYSSLPAMIVELKWNKSGEKAIGQFDQKRYDTVLRGAAGEILHVGISYDPKSGKHDCRIRKILDE